MIYLPWSLWQYMHPQFFVLGVLAFLLSSVVAEPCFPPNTLSQTPLRSCEVAGAMEAIQIAQTGGPEVLKLTKVEIPSITSDTQILVKNVFAGLNFIDTLVQRGHIPFQLPHIPGMEGAGVVEKVGSAVASTYPVGSRVAYMSFTAKAYGQYTVLDASAVTLIPEGVSYEDATGAMMQGLTAHYLVSEDGVYNIKKGDDVLIHAGAGGMGLLLSQIAAHRGANVVTTVSTAAKAALSKANGANVAIRYTDDEGKPVDWLEEALAATNGRGFNVVYDGVGKSTFVGSRDALRKRGILVMYGDSSGAPDPFTPSFFAGKSLFFSRPVLFHWVDREGELQSRAKDVYDWLKQGVISFEYTKFPLADASKAHEAMLARKTAGKVLIDIPQ